MEDICFWGDYDGGGDSADPVIRNSYALCLQTGGFPFMNNGTRQHPLNLQMGQEGKVSEMSSFFWTSCYPVIFPPGRVVSCILSCT